MQKQGYCVVVGEEGRGLIVWLMLSLAQLKGDFFMGTYGSIAYGGEDALLGLLLRGVLVLEREG